MQAITYFKLKKNLFLLTQLQKKIYLLSICQ